MIRHPAYGLESFTDAQLDDEVAFAQAERAAGGCLGQRTRIANRIKALECEQLRRLWEAS